MFKNLQLFILFYKSYYFIFKLKNVSFSEKDVHCFSYFFAIVKEELRKKEWMKQIGNERKSQRRKENNFKEESNKQMKY